MVREGSRRGERFCWRDKDCRMEKGGKDGKNKGRLHQNELTADCQAAGKTHAQQEQSLFPA